MIGSRRTVHGRIPLLDHVSALLLRSELSVVGGRSLNAVSFRPSDAYCSVVVRVGVVLQVSRHVLIRRSRRQSSSYFVSHSLFQVGGVVVEFLRQFDFVTGERDRLCDLRLIERDDERNALALHVEHSPNESVFVRVLQKRLHRCVVFRVHHGDGRVHLFLQCVLVVELVDARLRELVGHQELQVHLDVEACLLERSAKIFEHGLLAPQTRLGDLLLPRIHRPSPRRLRERPLHPKVPSRGLRAVCP